MRGSLRVLARKYRLSLIVLFGSEAQGKGRPSSDVDLAVWVEKLMTPSKELSLFAELGECFPGRVADVALLNGASPLLRFEVARTGKPLFEVRPGEFIRFRLMAMRQYWGTAKFRRMRAEYVQRAAGTR